MNEEMEDVWLVLVCLDLSFAVMPSICLNGSLAIRHWLHCLQLVNVIVGSYGDRNYLI